MKSFLKGLTLFAGISISILSLSFISINTGDGVWGAPAEANLIKNPFRGNSQETSHGKKLYTNMCVVCHGNKGKGDGMAGINLKPRPTNLTTTIVQNQSDGAIYWKITQGRAPMASYKEVLTEQQRWQLVNYIRELKK